MARKITHKIKKNKRIPFNWTMAEKIYHLEQEKNPVLSYREIGDIVGLSYERVRQYLNDFYGKKFGIKFSRRGGDKK